MKEEIKRLFKPFFWDVNIEKDLELKKHSFFIIERILEFGGDSEVQLLFEVYDLQIIKEVIIESKNLSPETVNYWCLKMGIKREITRCFTTLSQKIWMPY